MAKLNAQEKARVQALALVLVLALEILQLTNGGKTGGIMKLHPSTTGEIGGGLITTPILAQVHIIRLKVHIMKLLVAILEVEQLIQAQALILLKLKDQLQVVELAQELLQVLEMDKLLETVADQALEM